MNTLAYILRVNKSEAPILKNAPYFEENRPNPTPFPCSWRRIVYELWEFAGHYLSYSLSLNAFHGAKGFSLPCLHRVKIQQPFQGSL